MSFFFFNDTATTEIYTLSLHDALPISVVPVPGRFPSQRADDLAELPLGHRRVEHGDGFAHGEGDRRGTHAANGGTGEGVAWLGAASPDETRLGVAGPGEARPITLPFPRRPL